MRDLRIYVITIIISVLFLVPALICECPVFDTLSSIGCSGIAAAVMAIFLERANAKRECERTAMAKSLYFKQLYDQLIMMIERILWLDERLKDDNFNWNLPDQTYSTMSYMVEASRLYKEYSLAYDDAVDKLRSIGEKYNLDNIKRFSEEGVNKVNRLFQIVAAGSMYLLNEAKAVKDNKLLLNAENYLSMEENKDIMFEISLSVGLMAKKNKNYQVAINSLVKVVEKLREIGSYGKGDIRVGLHGSVPISEL